MVVRFVSLCSYGIAFIKIAVSFLVYCIRPFSLPKHIRSIVKVGRINQAYSQLKYKTRMRDYMYYLLGDDVPTMWQNGSIMCKSSQYKNAIFKFALWAWFI